MYITAQAIITPMVILLTSALWTWADFWVHPVRDLRALPWPARRCLQEGLVAGVVWIVTSMLYWQAFRWRMVYNGIGAGIGWTMMTLYVSTALRERAIHQANREQP